MHSYTEHQNKSLTVNSMRQWGNENKVYTFQKNCEYYGKPVYKKMGNISTFGIS